MNKPRPYDNAYIEILNRFNLTLAIEDRQALKLILKGLYNRGAADGIMAIEENR